MKWLLLAAGAGAGATYLLDSECGPQRRARVKEVVGSLRTKGLGAGTGSSPFSGNKPWSGESFSNGSPLSSVGSSFDSQASNAGHDTPEVSGGNRNAATAGPRS
ncbi:MAG: hypothetical protein NVSMB57_14090 [Actinomycetota bacterium]